MEKENERMRFRTAADLAVVLSREEISTNSSRYRSVDATSLKSQKISSSLYRWLDSLTGQNNFRFIDPNVQYKDLLDVLSYLESKKVVKEVSLGYERYNDAPSFVRCDMAINFLPGVTDGKTAYIGVAHGFGKDLGIAISQAIGEILERYPLTLYHRKEFVRSSYASIKQREPNVLNPSSVSFFSTEQKKCYPKFNFDDSSHYNWRKVKRISTKEEVWVPAQLVHWNYDFGYDLEEPMLLEPNTNGAGGMFTEEGAILSGIYELIQRDSFLIYWLNELSPPKVDPASVPDEAFQTIYQESLRYGFETHCLNTTLDTGVPSFSVVIIDKTGILPYFSLGAGCNTDPTKALYRALEEAWSVYAWMRRLGKKWSLPKDYVPFTHEPSVQPIERLYLAADQDNSEYYDFFLNGELKKFNDHIFNWAHEFATEKEELNALVKHIEAMGDGYQVLCYLPKHEVLSSLGYSSAHVVIPEFIHLYLREIHAPLETRRLKEVPQKLGLRVRDKFYTIPHPFP